MAPQIMLQIAVNSTLYAETIPPSGQVSTTLDWLTSTQADAYAAPVHTQLVSDDYLRVILLCIIFLIAVVGISVVMCYLRLHKETHTTFRIGKPKPISVELASVTDSSTRSRRGTPQSTYSSCARTVSLDVGTPSLPSDNRQRTDIVFEPELPHEIIRSRSALVRYMPRNESVFESPPDVRGTVVDAFNIKLEGVDFVLSGDDEVSCSTPL